MRFGPAIHCKRSPAPAPRTVESPAPSARSAGTRSQYRLNPAPDTATPARPTAAASHKAVPSVQPQQAKSPQQSRRPHRLPQSLTFVAQAWLNSLQAAVEPGLNHNSDLSDGGDTGAVAEDIVAL